MEVSTTTFSSRRTAVDRLEHFFLIRNLDFAFKKIFKFYKAMISISNLSYLRHDLM